MIEPNEKLLRKNPSLVAEVTFTDEQREALEKATGLSGLTGIRLVDLDAIGRDRLSPGLVRVTAMAMCW
jgi:hypothetical protein